MGNVHVIQALQNHPFPGHFLSMEGSEVHCGLMDCLLLIKTIILKIDSRVKPAGAGDCCIPLSCQVNLTSLNSICAHSLPQGNSSENITRQPGWENKLQHSANEHDTTLWRQHTFLTAVKGLFHGDHLQTTRFNNLGKKKG